MVVCKKVNGTIKVKIGGSLLKEICVRQTKTNKLKIR